MLFIHAFDIFLTFWLWIIISRKKSLTQQRNAGSDDKEKKVSQDNVQLFIGQHINEMIEKVREYAGGGGGSIAGNDNIFPINVCTIDSQTIYLHYRPQTLMTRGQEALNQKYSFIFIYFIIF